MAFGIRGLCSTPAFVHSEGACGSHLLTLFFYDADNPAETLASDAKFISGNNPMVGKESAANN